MHISRLHELYLYIVRFYRLFDHLFSLSHFLVPLQAQKLLDRLLIKLLGI
jgi:hypothetical protein